MSVKPIGSSRVRYVFQSYGPEFSGWMSSYLSAQTLKSVPRCIASAVFAAVVSSNSAGAVCSVHRLLKRQNDLNCNMSAMASS